MKSLLALAALVLLGSAADAQQLRPVIARPTPPFNPGMPHRVHYIDTSWQNSPYTYWLIHHHGMPPYPYPPYPYPYPPYPNPYTPYPYYPGGYVPLPNYYGGTPDPANPYSGKPTTAVLPQISGNNAVVTVKVPLALASVTFDGNQTTTTGMTRVYTTPELQPGKTYTYTVTANWSEAGYPRSVTRTVQVTAGQHATVDLSRN